MKLMQVIGLAAACVGLMSCGDSLEKRFPPALDYCANEKRVIPNSEKISRILLRWYKDNEIHQNVYVVDARYGSKKSFNWSAGPDHVRKYLDGVTSPKADDAEIMIEVANYLQKNPLCCQIMKPDHLGNQVWNGDAWMADNEYISAYKWGYFSDVYFFRSPPFHKIDGAIQEKDVFPNKNARGKQQGFALMLNNCAETKAFFRG